MKLGEGIFRALTVESGDRIKTKKRLSTKLFGALTVEFGEHSMKTRTLLRITTYRLKIPVRWAYE